MSSERPGILCGGGAWGAREAIIGYAVENAIPCFRTWNALDVITDDLPVYCGTVGTYGGPGRNFGVQNCDELLVLGCKLSGKITGGLPHTFARGARKTIVDIDPDMLEPDLQEVEGDVNVRKSCEQYMAFAPPVEKRPEWLARCRQWVEKYDPVTPAMLSGGFHHYAFMRRLSQRLPANAIVVYDTGGNAIMMGHCFQSKRGQRIFSSNGNTPMGFAMCGAIGAWFAAPERPVICIIGDGGMNMNIQELQTLVNYGCKVKVFIVNNHVLGNTKSYQRVNGMQEVACGPDGYRPPNFSAIALAYGIESLSLGENERFEFVVSRALAADHAVIVDAVHHDFCQYEPRVSRWDCGIEEAYPPLPEFLENMIIQPLEGWEKR